MLLRAPINATASNRVFAFSGIKDVEGRPSAWNGQCTGVEEATLSPQTEGGTGKGREGDLTRSLACIPQVQRGIGDVGPRLEFCKN